MTSLSFRFPVRALSVVFRAKYLEALQQAFEAGQLDFAGETTTLAEPSAFRAFLAKLRAKDWHVLPKGFMRIRNSGVLANRHRTEHLAACRATLDAPTPAPREAETVEAFLARVLGTEANRCPHCGQGRLRPIRALPPLSRATGPPLLRWAA